MQLQRGNTGVELHCDVTENRCRPAYTSRILTWDITVCQEKLTFNQEFILFMTINFLTDVIDRMRKKR